MSIENKKVNFDGGKNFRQKNFQERIWFIKYWADFVKNNPDEVWSKGQRDVIDSQFQSAQRFYKNLEKSEKGREILERLKKERFKSKAKGFK